VTVTSLAFGGVTLTDSCRTAAYDSVAAYTAAVAADAYVPSPSLIGRSDCACTDCPTPAPSLWPTQPGKLAPWVAADRPDSAELWDVRSSVWERQTAITDSGEPCGPTSWRWEVELVGSPAGRRHGVTWLTQRLHAAAGCRAGSCTDCGAHTLAVAEDCGPVRTVRDARAVVVRELFDDVGPCTSRVEVLFEAADGRMWDAPEVVASYPAAAWGAAECNPLHPLLIDCDCTPDPCAPTAVRWDSIQPGCIVVPGEGDESILTRVIQSPDASAFYDLTRAGLRAPFRRVDVYDTTGGTVRAAPSGVVWSLAGVPGGPANTTVVAVIDADGVSCQFRLGLLAVFCRAPIVDRPAFDSTSTLVRAAQQLPVTQPLPAFDKHNPNPVPTIYSYGWPDPDLTTTRLYEDKPEIEVTPFIPGDPLADPPVPDIPATYRTAMTGGSIYVSADSAQTGIVGFGGEARNTGRENRLTNATIRIWLPKNRRNNGSLSAAASNTASIGTTYYHPIGYYEIPVNYIGLPSEGGGSVYFDVSGIGGDYSQNPIGACTVEMFPDSAVSSLSAPVSDTSLSPSARNPGFDKSNYGAVLNASLHPLVTTMAPGSTYAGEVWSIKAQSTGDVEQGFPGTDPTPTPGGTGAFGIGTMRIWKPAQVTSWTVTATGGYNLYFPRVVTDLGRYVEITGWYILKTGLAGTDALNVSITNVTRNNADDDIEPLQVDMWATNWGDGVPGSVRQTTGQSYTDSAPGPVAPVVQPTPNVTAYVNASLSRNVSSIARGATITDDVWTVFVAANGEHPITGGTLRINMPSGVSSWAWSVNTVGFVTYDDNSPAGGRPYIELANIVAGNHPASYMTVTISRVTHDDSLDDVGTLTAELFGGFFGNLSATATDTAPGPTLGPCPPSRWYEDAEFQHATIVSGPDGIAWWSWDGAVGRVTSVATNGIVTQQGAGFRWQSDDADKTGAVTLSDESGRHAVVAIQPGPHLAESLDCDTVITPPTAGPDECDTWCEPFMRRTLFISAAAESTDYAPALRFSNGAAVDVGVHVWTDPATCPPTSEACPPADRVIPVALPYISTTTLGSDTISRGRLTHTCDDPIRGLPEVTTDCGGLCIGLTIEGDATPPVTVELLGQSWVE
jgi:hypothetical protein